MTWTPFFARWKSIAIRHCADSRLPWVRGPNSAASSHPARIRPGSSASNLRLYEAQQPPLAYLLYWIPYVLLQGADITTRAWALRIIGAAIASFVVPLGFVVARRVFRNEWQAVGVAAVAASMPELIMMVDHAGNEPLAIVLGAGCVYALSLMENHARRPLLRALSLGSLIGCGLLTKAYFLALIPPIAGVYAVLMWRNPGSRGRIGVQLLITLAAATAIAGWWYGRAIYTTGTLTGNEIAIAARHSTRPLLGAIQAIHWGRVADFALLSHIWLGGWSFLVLRTWMYRVIGFVLVVGQVGNLRRVGNPPGRLSANLAICIAVQVFFWAGLIYLMFSTWIATGEGAEPGYYAYFLVVPEAVSLIAGFSALIPISSTRFIVPALVVCFAAAEVYGTVFCLMPYYGGLTAHSIRGSVPAMHASRLLNGGVAELFRNLAVNKPDFLSPGVLLVLCVSFLLAVVGVVAVSVLLASGGERGKAGSVAANGLVPLGSR